MSSSCNRTEVPTGHGKKQEFFPNHKKERVMTVMDKKEI